MPVVESNAGPARRERFYAHSLEDQPPEHWEPLEAHLRRVADGHDLHEQTGFPGAAGFAAAFGARHWARLAGLWHDMGKYAAQFQHYLREVAASEGDFHQAQLRGSVDHSTAGAVQAVRLLGAAGYPLAYGIAGHHGGLPNSIAAEGERERSGLLERVKNPPDESDNALANAPTWLIDAQAPDPPPLTFDLERPNRLAFQIAFFTRMLYSCLVDADYLATEQFLDPRRHSSRPDMSPSMTELREQVDRHLDRMSEKAQRCRPGSTVNEQRAHVLQCCRAAAERSPGVFSLTVPTGGGKTLSSLAFALRHAERHGLRRVIAAIPFTSIIEQNAGEYRKALGALQHHVIEHHSNLDPGKETVRNRLAAENWDAPIVVTTNVQLLESMFACRSGRCRKLHRIARSVIVLDEAQALPPNLLAPTLAALRELVTNYGCTIVLCTATQPALEQRHEFPIGLEHPKPIVEQADRDRLFQTLKRVEVEQAGPMTDQALTDRLAQHEQALCIVNTRSHAAELFEKLTERFGETEMVHRGLVSVPRVGSCLHLSANMCPRHRSAVLRLIRHRLRNGRPCRVVSTQLVEAGVDVDFPVVYRATAGLDSIAQAAGRCNREGRLDGTGRVVVFEPDEEERSLPPFVRQPVQDAREILPDHPDPLTPEAQRAYFALHYWKRGGDDGSGWDRPPGAGPGDSGVLRCFADAGDTLQFRQAAERYRLIADDQQPLLVPYGPRGRELIEQLRQMWNPPGRDFDRRLQRLAVGVRAPSIAQLQENRQLWPATETHERHVLASDAAYDRRMGLQMDSIGMAPEMLQG